VEASAWSIMALAGSQAAHAAVLALGRAQNSDGGWSTAPGMGRSDWSSGLALLALRHADMKREGIKSPEGDTSEKIDVWPWIERGLGYLLESRTDFYKPTARLLLLLAKGPEALAYARGWPWDPECFHWVEPTSYCLLAVKLPGLPLQALYERVIYFADKFLLEHQCSDGGWNHGNDVTLGAQLPSYRLTTAEALLALQNLAPDPKIEKALDYLQSLSGQDSSSHSLALSILALVVYQDLYKTRFEQELEFLLARQKEDGSFGPSVLSTALAVLALKSVLAPGEWQCPLRMRRGPRKLVGFLSL
jgi:hypothetical protein